MRTDFRLSPEETARLLKLYAETGDVAHRDRAVEGHLYIAEIIARKFSGRGVDCDDLFQVAALALTRAAERFDAERGIQFASFATPCMVGEVKNYFRDRSRLIRTPRRGAELMRIIESAREELTQSLGRAPRSDELAAHAGLGEDDVLEALETAAMQPVSMDAPPPEGERGVAETLGAEERGFLDFENADLLRRSMETLTDRQREVIELRFFENLSQREAARKLGVSQMSISRTERSALECMRRALEPEINGRS